MHLLLKYFMSLEEKGSIGYEFDYIEYILREKITLRNPNDLPRLMKHIKMHLISENTIMSEKFSENTGYIVRDKIPLKNPNKLPKLMTHIKIALNKLDKDRDELGKAFFGYFQNI